MAEEKEACSSLQLPYPLLLPVMIILCWLCHLSDLQKVDRIRTQTPMDNSSFWVNYFTWLTKEYQGHCGERERLHEGQDGKEMGERNRSGGGEA